MLFLRWRSRRLASVCADSQLMTRSRAACSVVARPLPAALPRSCRCAALRRRLRRGSRRSGRAGRSRHSGLPSARRELRRRSTRIRAASSRATTRDTPRSPASTIKVVTTFAGLDLAGARLYLAHAGPVHGVAATAACSTGISILQGGGDPYMTLERWWSFVQELRAKGLNSIRGDIVIDDTAFSLPPEDPGAFDGRPNRAYNVVPDALMVNFQSIEFRLVPNAGTRSDRHHRDAGSGQSRDRQSHRASRPAAAAAAAARVDFEVSADAVGPRRFLRRLVAAVRASAPSRGCCCRRRATPSARSSHCGGESGGEFDGKLRIERRRRTREPLLELRLVDARRRSCGSPTNTATI